MAIPNRTKMQRYFAELQRLEETRSMGAEKEIQKAYKAMLKDLRQFLGEEYGKYAVDDALTYSTLAQKGQYARFLEEVQKKVNGITPRVNSAITKVVKETYRMAYEGMVQAVAVAVNDKQLEQLLSGIHLTEAEVIKAAVNNPVSKLTLSKTLEKNRKQIVHNIKQTVTVGIMNGDRMSTMAKKIQADVEQNYRKAMLIARTEVHRVRETGHNDGAASVDNILAEENYDYRMVKVWKSMRDASVRKTSKADHRKMNGQTVLQDEDFKLGRGVTAPCPGQSGTAYNDCNCRCYVSHDLMSDSEFFQATGRHFKEVEKPKKEKPKEEKKPESGFRPAETIADAEAYAKKFAKNVSFSGTTNLETVNAVNETLDMLASKYPVKQLDHVRTNSRLRSAAARANYEGLELQTKFLEKPPQASDWQARKERNLKHIEKYKELIAEARTNSAKAKYRKYLREVEREQLFNRWTVSGDKSGAEHVASTVIHEYGHILADQYIGQINRKRANSKWDYGSENELNRMCSKIAYTHHKAKESGDIYNISMYADSDEYEFFAETFAMYVQGETLPDYIETMIKEVLAFGTV